MEAREARLSELIMRGYVTRWDGFQGLEEACVHTFELASRLTPY